MDLPGVLELRVNTPSLYLYPVPPLTISSDMLAATATSPAAPSICLLRGPLRGCSRQEASKWSIGLAHDICDPAKLCGSLLVWKEPLQQWRPVADTVPLTDSIYRYHLPVEITVDLSKISRRVAKFKSVTTHASAMAGRVKRRDGECWVKGVDDPLANSYIAPSAREIILGESSSILLLYFSRSPPRSLHLRRNFRPESVEDTRCLV
ncbi:hypothetical protein C8F04DRAFT_269156 [Mycena alexandri]|uniref:Uncharacterized protein n=1 Tax=Mycena alexandri TaxID=1745969 RepID=A0AAD6WNT0_9AGAR|nr:hypothetical protein C8F04DRAFT_269156 [Mycena alexandri]